MSDTATIEPPVAQVEPIDASTPVPKPEELAPEETVSVPKDRLAELEDSAGKLAKVIEAGQRLSGFHVEYLEAAEHAKSTKKRWEAGAEELQNHISRLGQKMPLFDKPAPKEEPKKSEEWRDVDIDILTNHGLSAAIVEKLRDSSFSTIGSLADWTSGDNLLTAIDGIGPKKADAIETALEGFWAANPQYGQAQVAERVATVDAEANGESVDPSANGSP